MKKNHYPTKKNLNKARGFYEDRGETKTILKYLEEWLTVLDRDKARYTQYKEPAQFTVTKTRRDLVESFIIWIETNVRNA